MEYRIILKPDPEDGGYVAHCPALPGCYSQGDTREEAISNAREAIAAYIESLRKDGLPIPGDEVAWSASSCVRRSVDFSTREN